MRINLTTICWNEEHILPHFLEHYFSQGVDHITVYDNGSTDQSIDICKKYGDKVTVIQYDSNNQIRDDIYLQIKNEAWKKTPGDWNIVVDCDEFLMTHEKYSKKQQPLKNQLQTFKRKGNLLPRVIGVNVVSEDIKKADELTDKMFVLDQAFNKRCVFTPKLVPIFKTGCHNFSLNTQMNKKDLEKAINNDECDPLFLFHYKYINVERVLARFKEMNARLSEYNKQNNYGTQYTKDEASIRATFKYMQRYAITLKELMSRYA